jgi:hypothetical protein
LSPKGSTQPIKELYLQVGSVEEKNAWMDAFSLHTQYIESIASMTKSFPNPVPLLVAHVQTLEPPPEEAQEVKKEIHDDTTKKTAIVEDEEGDIDDDASVVTTTTVGSQNTTLTASTANTSALLDAIYRSPNVVTSASSSISPPRARPTFTTSRSLNLSSASPARSRSNSPIRSNGSRSNSPVRPGLYHQPSLRHALIVSSAEALSNVKMKIPLKVQQLCPPGEKILLCGMVSTMNRAYVYVIRFVVYLRKDPSTEPATIATDSSSTPMILKRILCLDAYSYVTKQEIVWSQPALGVIANPSEKQVSIIPTVRVVSSNTIPLLLPFDGVLSILCVL